MYVKSSFSGTWKYQKWKLKFRSYSTQENLHRYHQSYIVSTNKAITNHARNGELGIARKLFDQMPQRTVVSWNIMISGYSKWGRYNESLYLLRAMHQNNVRLNDATFSSGLSACARLSVLSEGKQAHGIIIKYGSEEFELVGSALLYFYSNCYEIELAKRVFDYLHRRNGLLWNLMLVGYLLCNLMDEAFDFFNSMPSRDTVAWTSLISGFTKRDGDGCAKALELFRVMRESGEAAPNEFTLDCVLRAYGEVGNLHDGRGVHGLVIRSGFESEDSINCAIVDFYCRCRAVDDAKRSYHEIVNPKVDASNTLIEGLITMDRIEEAELIFARLEKRNPFTYNLMIKGYSLCGRCEDSEELFQKMPQRIPASSNTMIAVYSRNQELDKAVELFNQTKDEKDPVTWNSMISGYVNDDQHENAFKLFMAMHKMHIDKNRSTFSALFHGCSCLGSLQLGKLLHAHLVKTPHESNVYVGTSLVDMYAKCGSISDAQSSFFSIVNPNVATWTALINGYAHHGLCSEAILLFKHMLKQGVNPNAATFVGVLSACARAGLVKEGMRYFQSMEVSYGVTPTLEHYTCSVDLLGRSGCLQEAEDLINEMPMKTDKVVYGALLNACWFWMDMEVGERVAKKMIPLDPKPTSAYVIMSNLYAGLGKWREKMRARKTLNELEAKKDPGCSWIELNKNIHVFAVEDRTHSCCTLIYSTLEHLTTNGNSIIQSDIAHIPDTEIIDEKPQHSTVTRLFFHVLVSEKLNRMQAILYTDLELFSPLLATSLCPMAMVKSQAPVDGSKAEIHWISPQV